MDTKLIELARADGTAVLTVLHDLNLAAEYCDRIYLLRQGRVEAAGRTEEVFTYANLTAVFETEVYVDTNDLTGQLDRVLDRSQVTYVLSFQPQELAFDGSYHKIKVELVDKKGTRVSHRAGYYEQAGVLRDMVQNHLLQVLTLVAMEPPTHMHQDAVRDEKLKVIRALDPVEVLTFFLVLQVPLTAQGQQVLLQRDVDQVCRAGILDPQVIRYVHVGQHAGDRRAQERAPVEHGTRSIRHLGCDSASTTRWLRGTPRTRLRRLGPQASPPCRPA